MPEPTAFTENCAVEPTVAVCGVGDTRMIGAVELPVPEVGLVTVNVRVEAGPVPSAFAALAVRLYVPTVFGVPASMPVVELNESPDGIPERLKVNGLLLAVSAYEKGLPAGAVSVVALVIEEKAPIVRVRFSVGPLPKEFAAEIGTIATWGEVGVPLMTPVEALSERPAGRADAENDVGPFVAVIE